MIINDLESKSSDILMVSLFYSYMEDMNVWSLYVVSVSYRLSKAKNEEKEELAKPKHADYKSKASLSSFNDRGVVKRVWTFECSKHDGTFSYEGGHKMIRLVPRWNVVWDRIIATFQIWMCIVHTNISISKHGLLEKLIFTHCPKISIFIIVQTLRLSTNILVYKTIQDLVFSRIWTY